VPSKAYLHEENVDFKLIKFVICFSV